ncbi:cyclic dehypoxanthinyl futalosine synthase [Oceanithermus sp.]
MDVLQRALAGERLERADLLRLYQLPLPEVAAVAHQLRLRRSDPRYVTYLIDRNINYTNVCTIACGYCAFYRTRRQPDAYTLSYEEIGRKVAELEEIGGRRILMQGGVNPDLPLEWYEGLLRYLKERHPQVRVDAFSPEEILGLEKLTGLPAGEVLKRLKEAGLDGVPGAGAEILVDRIRHAAAPARISTADWVRIVEEVLALGMYSLASMVIGMGEGPEERVEHLLVVRELQDRALARYGHGFSGFALWTMQLENTRLAGRLPGASAYEYLQTLAIARIALDNIAGHQASWPTMGFKIAQTALYYGANDFGSTMLEEQVVSAASGNVRQSATVREIVRQIVEAGFLPAERNVFYEIINRPDPRAILSSSQ